eukprot:tig00000144_g9062.t1
MPPNAPGDPGPSFEADGGDGRSCLARIRTRAPGLYSMVELLWHDGAVDLSTLRVHQTLYNQVVEDFNQLVKISQPLLGGHPPVATLPIESLPSESERSHTRRSSESRVLSAVHDTQRLLDERMGRMQTQLKAALDEKLRLQEELAEARRANSMMQEQARRREAELVTAIEREAEHKARAQLHRDRLEEELSRARGGEEDADAHLHEVHRALDGALEQIKQLGARRDALEAELAFERGEHAACQQRLSEATWQLEGARERAAGKEAQAREAQAAAAEAERRAVAEVEARAQLQGEALLLRAQLRDAEERAAALARAAGSEGDTVRRAASLVEEVERREAEVRELEARRARILDAVEAALRDLAAAAARAPPPAPAPAPRPPRPGPGPCARDAAGAGGKGGVTGCGVATLAEAAREVAALEARRRAADAAAHDEEAAERERLRRAREELVRLGREAMAAERRRNELREETAALEARREELAGDLHRLARSAHEEALLAGPAAPGPEAAARLAALEERGVALEERCREQEAEIRALNERNFRLVERLHRLGARSPSPSKGPRSPGADPEHDAARSSPRSSVPDELEAARVSTGALKAARGRLQELAEGGRALRRALEEAARGGSANPSPYATPAKRDAGSESDGEGEEGTLLEKLSALDARIEGVAEAAGEIARRADRLAGVREEAGQLAARLAALEANAAALAEARPAPPRPRPALPGPSEAGAGVEEAVRVREAFGAWRGRMAKLEELAAVRGEELHEKRLQAQRAAGQLGALGEALRAAEREGELLREKARALAAALAAAALPSRPASAPPRPAPHPPRPGPAEADGAQAVEVDAEIDAVAASRATLALALAAASSPGTLRAPAGPPPSPPHEPYVSRYAAAAFRSSPTPPPPAPSPFLAPIAPAPAPPPSAQPPPVPPRPTYRPLPPVPAQPPADDTGSLFSQPAASLLPQGFTAGAGTFAGPPPPPPPPPPARGWSPSPDYDASDAASVGSRGRAREPRETHRFSAEHFGAPVPTLGGPPGPATRTTTTTRPRAPPRPGPRPAPAPATRVRCGAQSPRSVRSEPAGPRSRGGGAGAGGPRRSALRGATGRHSVDALRAGTPPLSASHARKRLRFLQHEEGPLAEEGPAPAPAPGEEPAPPPYSPEGDHRAMVQRMMRGTVMTKFAFTTMRRVTRWLVLDNGPPRRVRWGDPASRRLTSSAEVDDIVGLTHGPFGSRSFERREPGRDHEWLCFSLHFPNRTVDLCAPSEAALVSWYIGLQTLVAPRALPAFQLYSPADLRHRIELMRARSLREGSARALQRPSPEPPRARSRSASPARKPLSFAESPGGGGHGWGVAPAPARRSSFNR